MTHRLTHVWIHYVWGTKYRENVFDNTNRDLVANKIRAEAYELKCSVRAVKVMPDHVHLLTRHNPVLSISDFVHQVKGASSDWIKKTELLGRKFGWQVGYGAFSVSMYHIDKVANYIKNQDRHHGLEP